MKTDKNTSDAAAKKPSTVPEMAQHLPWPWKLARAVLLIAIASGLWWSVSGRVSDSHLAAELQLLNEDRNAELIQRLQSQDLKDPASPEQQLLLAIAYARQGDISRAETTLREAGQRGAREDQLNAYSALIQAYAGEMTLAEPLLPSLLTGELVDAGTVCDAFVSGYLLNYQFDQADSLLQAWLEDRPKDFRPAAYRGQIAQMVTQWDRAIAEFQTAIELGDWRSRTRLRLGQCGLEARQLVLARESFERVIAADPGTLEAWRGLGMALQLSGNPRESKEAFLNCLRLDPYDFDVILELAKAEFAEGDIGSARDRLKRFLEDWPEDAQALQLYSQILARQGEAESAEEIRGRWEAANRQLEEMEASIRELQSRPDSPELRRDVGVMLLKLYSRNMGRQFLESVIRLAPGDRVAHDVLADFYQKKQQNVLADHHRQAAQVPDAGQVKLP